MGRIAIANTDYEWFNLLKNNEYTEDVNFWTPTPWKIKGLNKGDIFYLFLKSPHRKIGGYGIFEYYTELTVKESWKKFGIGNGVSNYFELLERTHKYALKNSKNFKPIKNPTIGCIVLSGVVYFDEQDYFLPETRNWSFPKQIVKLKYLDDNNHEPIEREHENVTQEFNLVKNTSGNRKTCNIKYRQGQVQFRKNLLETYKCCAITKEDCSLVLEAAHIQEYINKSSNHMQNGLLLRADVHKLFDNGLITITPDYKIKVSEELPQTYKKYNGEKIHLPDNLDNYPSKDALEWHNKALFRD